MNRYPIARATAAVAALLVTACGSASPPPATPTASPTTATATAVASIAATPVTTHVCPFYIADSTGKAILVTTNSFDTCPAVHSLLVGAVGATGAVTDMLPGDPNVTKHGAPYCTKTGPNGLTYEVFDDGDLLLNSALCG